LVEVKAVMRIVGLTGGIASGKSLAAHYFESLSVDVIDADQLARDSLRPGQPAFDAVFNRYGADILTETGDIDRGRLCESALFKPDEKRWLESLLHPQVRADIFRWLDQVAARADPPAYSIVMAPLLVETGLYRSFDSLLVIDCSVSLQVHRACQRDSSMTPEKVNKIILLQASRKARSEKADYIILNESDRDALSEQVVRLHKSFCDDL